MINLSLNKLKLVAKNRGYENKSEDKNKKKRHQGQI